MANNQPGGFDMPGYDAAQQAQGKTNFFNFDTQNRFFSAGSIPLPPQDVDPQTLFWVIGSINSYIDMVSINLSTGGTAQADFVAVCGPNIGTGLPGTYVDMGITSHGFNDANQALFDADVGYVYNNVGNLYVGAGTTGTLTFFTNGYDSKSRARMNLDPNGNITLGTGAVGSAATNGFAYITGGTGVPTGTPATKTGMVPLYVNLTTNVMYFYNGAWKAGTFA